MVALLFSVTASCGAASSQRSPAALYADAEKAALSASSVHITTATTLGGVRFTDELWLGRKRGRYVTTAPKLRFEVIRIGNEAYFRGTEAFLARFVGVSTARRLHGGWGKSRDTGGPGFRGVRGETSIATFFEELFKTPPAKVSDRGAATYRGRRARILDVDGGLVYIAAEGTPYVLSLGRGKNAFAFSDWNRPLDIHTPSAAVRIDFR